MTLPCQTEVVTAVTFQSHRCLVRQPQGIKKARVVGRAIDINGHMHLSPYHWTGNPKGGKETRFGATNVMLTSPLLTCGARANIKLGGSIGGGIALTIIITTHADLITLGSWQMGAVD